MALIDNLVPYQKGVRPVDPASMPYWIDAELDRAAAITRKLVEIIKDHEARLVAGSL
jgi:hypothetical protein